MPKTKSSAITLIAASVLIFFAPVCLALTEQQLKMQKQLDQLDQLDHQEFLDHERSALRCISKRDFPCAQSFIAKASKVAGLSEDKKALKSLKNELNTEQMTVATELAAAAQLKREREALAAREEEEREQEAREEEEREAREEEEREQAQRRNRDQESSGPDPMLAAIESIGNYATKSLNDYSQMVQSQNAQIEADRRRRQRDADDRRAQQVEQNRRDQQAANERRQAQANRQTEMNRQRQQDSERRLAMLQQQEAENRQREQQARQQREIERQQLQSKREQQQREQDAAERKAEAVRAKAVEQESKKKALGRELIEGVAACWQNQRNKDFWRCDGPLQDTILSDETLDVQLGFAGCSNPRADDGTRTIKGNITAKIFLCGYGLEGGRDRDIALKYGFTVQRNKYQCAVNHVRECRDNYQLTH